MMDVAVLSVEGVLNTEMPAMRKCPNHGFCC